MITEPEGEGEELNSTEDSLQGSEELNLPGKDEMFGRSSDSTVQGLPSVPDPKRRGF